MSIAHILTGTVHPNKESYTRMDEARHEKVVSLVEMMLELHKASPRMPQDKERVSME